MALAPAPDWWSPPTPTKKKPLYTDADIAASLAANPQASKGGYEGVGATYATSAPMAGAGDIFKQAPAPSLNVAGYDPDYQALIAGDPSLLAGTADVEQYRGSLESARRAAIQRAVIQSGLRPSIPIADLDQATLDAAAANQFSGAAELGRNRQRGQTDLEANLAGRGLLASGGLEGGAQRLQEGYERGTSSLTQQLLDLISGVEGSTAGKNSELNQRIAQLRADAAARVAADPRYQPIGDADAVLDPESGLYVTADGRWYTSDGKRAPMPASWGHGLPPPAAAPPAAPSQPDYASQAALYEAQAAANTPAPASVLPSYPTTPAAGLPVAATPQAQWAAALAAPPVVIPSTQNIVPQIATEQNRQPAYDAITAMGPPPSAKALIAEGVPVDIARRIAREASYGADF